MDRDLVPRPLRNRLRGLSVRCALICVVAYSSGAPAHNIAPDLALQEPGTRQFLPETPEDRWVVAIDGPRRASVPENNGASGTIARPAAARPSSRQASLRTTGDVVAVTTTGPGQSGYVHYFVIEASDGERETQIGIELPDGRIAWSFPGLGVVVSPFLESGELRAGTQVYSVRHRYGVRPFRNGNAMVALQEDLWNRVIPWVEDGTPHCNLAAPRNQPCLSCLDFVMRVLYPSHSGGMPALPPDFERTGIETYFTTEDLLLYQAGLQGSQSLPERMSRINALTLPPALRTDLIEIAQSIATGDDIASVATPEKITPGKQPPGRPRSKAGHPRPSSPKNL